MNAPKQVAVIGSNASGATVAMADFAFALGQMLGTEGYTVINGGKGGVMEAVCRGIRHSPNPQRGRSVCIIPEGEPAYANPFCDIIIPTGIGLARNFIVANSAPVVIAVGGGAGTLSEVAYAWQTGKIIIAVTSFGGWARKLAGTQIDNRRNDIILPARSVEEIRTLLQEIFKP